MASDDKWTGFFILAVWSKVIEYISHNTTYLIDSIVYGNVILCLKIVSENDI